MLETAVGDGPLKLWLQQEVPESCRVDADIAALLVGSTSSHVQVAFLGCSIGSCWCCCCVVGLEFFVGIIDEIFFVRHIKSQVVAGIEKSACVKMGMLRSKTDIQSFRGGRAGCAVNFEQGFLRIKILKMIAKPQTEGPL